MPKRYLIVPDAQIPDALLVRAAATADSSLQQDGLKVHQPEDRSGELVQGDIRPSLSGTPEEYSKGLITVNKAGVVEDARFGWMRDGDDETEDLQLRQSPHVCGRLVDMIARKSGTNSPTRPKLLSLKSGNLYCAWLEVLHQPIYVLWRAAGGFVKQSILDKTTNRWSASGVGPQPDDSASAILTYIAAFDVIQYPDTGELMMVVLVQSQLFSAACSPRRLFLYYSLDDGTTWTERGHRHFDGDIPDIMLDSNGDGTPDAAAAIASCALELMDSGRLVMMMITVTATWSLVSDDRGATWSATLVYTHTTDEDYDASHGVGSTKARNGYAIFTAAYRNQFDDSTEVFAYLTQNGIDFSSRIGISSEMVTIDASICVSPDGFLHVYATFHRAHGNGLVTQRDWMWGRRLKTRDPILSHTSGDLIPYSPVYGISISSKAFHGTKASTSNGQYMTSGFGVDPVVKYNGFVGIDSVEHRGQTYIAVIHHRHDPATGTGSADGLTDPPTTLSSSLMCYRTNHWQPIQERLGNANSAALVWEPLFPMAGRVYNRTWDCYDLPSDVGWTSAGAGVAAIAASAGVENGYMAILSTPARSFADAGLPAPNSTKDGAIRMVVQAVVGGATTSDRIALRFFFSVAGVASCGIVRLARGASTTTVALINWNTGAVIGSTTFPNDQWIEILVAVKDTGANFSVTAAARSFDRTNDTDFECPYTMFASATGLTTVAVLDGVAFGNFTDTNDTSWWKTVQIHRTSVVGFCALDQQPSNLVDSDQDADLASSGTGETLLDSGIDNVMRTSRTSASPGQFITDGVRATWRGEAITDGQFTFETGYDYAAENVLNAPVREEWRSVDTAKAIELVFDSGWDAGSGVKFRPEAFAAFGRNFPELTVQLNDSDSWGAPSVSRTYGCWGAALTPQRYTHLWAMKLSGGWGYYISGFRLTVYQSPSAQTTVSPWRPHQFRTNPVGSRYYCVFRNADTGISYIYRIADNTEDTLVFVTAPDIALVTAGGSPTDFAYDFAIYADCFASRLDHRYAASFTDGVKTYGNTHPVGFRYARLLMPAVTHKDADEAFYRLGYALMGQMVEMHSPDPQWGFSIETASGHDVSYGQGGVGSARRRSAPRRSWHLDYSYMSPPAESAASFLSPSENLIESKRSWQHWLDVVRRVEVDGTPVAFVFDGERADGASGEAVVPVACDPASLMLTRVTNPGTVEHVVWEDRSVILPNSTDCTPYPSMVIRGITFTEEF